MATGTKARRLVDALDDVAREMRTANLIEALRLGTSALDDVDTAVIKSDATKQRQARLNKVRAGIRQALDIEEQQQVANQIAYFEASSATPDADTIARMKEVLGL